MGDTEAKNSILKGLKELSGHNYLKLTNSGNSAIFLAFYISKKHGRKTILIPDQGGWMTYKTFPEVLGLEVVELKTAYGIIDLNELSEKADKGCALIMPALAGYMAEQPLEEISRICKQKGCLLIVDISGSIGMEGFDYSSSDMVVCSFGKWKVADLNYGGFISTSKKGFFQIDHSLFKMFDFHQSFCDEFIQKLDKVKERSSFLIGICEKIKKDLMDFDIIHRGNRGINVIVKFGNKSEEQKLIKYCIENNYEYTTCPKYIKVLDDAISIEVKRLIRRD